MNDVHHKGPMLSLVSGVIQFGNVLTAGAHEPVSASIAWDSGQITSVDAGPQDAATTIDASGCLVLPGIIDLHGDAFERALMPRGGVRLSMDIALDENDAQLLASGITTSFLSATDSWEPGLRSRATLRELIDALSDRDTGPRVLLHVRHERCNTDDIDELLAWVETGAIQALSYNDHTPGGNEHIRGLSASQIGRAGVSEAELLELLESAVSRRAIGAEQDEALAKAAHRANVPTASHDPAFDEDLARDLELGVKFAEFPLSIELAHKYCEAGVPVLLGAPNLVRGGSHLGNLAVADAIRANVTDILCSDYHYPSLLQAPFMAVEQGLVTLAEAWDMVSGAPARAAGLDDRGQLTPGASADIIVVEPPAYGRPARVVHVVVGGQLVYSRQRCEH